MSSTFLWRVFLATAFVQAIGSFLYFVLLENETAIQFTYTATKTIMVFAPLALLLCGFKMPSPTKGKEHSRSLFLGIGSGAGIFVLILIVYQLFFSVFAPYAPALFAKIVEVGIWEYYWIAAIGISLVHSLLEEYYWRWYIVKGLETHLAFFPSLLIGNALFTLHHYLILSQFVSLPLTFLLGTCVGLGGCLWSLIYRKTGSLLGAWVSHVFADLAIFIVGYFLVLSFL